MKDLFTAIVTAIDATNQVRWIDEDLGQLETPAAPPVSWPCALIAFDSGESANLYGSAQIIEPRISIRLGFRLHERTHSKAASTPRAQALEYMDIVQAVHYALQGLSGPNFQGLSRISFTNARRADYRIWTLVYSCSYTDCPMPAGPNDTLYLPWADAGGTAPGPGLQLQPDLIIPGE